MKQNHSFIMTMSNLLSTSVIVSILVSVYIATNIDSEQITLQYIIWYIQHATCHSVTNKQYIPNGPISHSWSHIGSRRERESIGFRAYSIYCCADALQIIKSI